MQRLTFVLVLSVLLLLASLIAPPDAAAAECEELTSLASEKVEITSARFVEAGSFTLEGGRGGPRAVPDLGGFCRVEATLRPVPGSEIGIELWMPSREDWNGKYLAVGNGAFAGSISRNALLDPLRRGYAASSTDTGHTSPGGDFALDPEPLTDFAYRAVHEMAVESKRLVAAYYGEDTRYSFFSGCSTGGRQALAAAQRFPTDFDGIVAGAPANYTTHLQGAQIWMSRVGRTGDRMPIPPQKLQLINDAVLNACDTLDGVEDRVIENPPMCRFDPAALTCTGADGDSCLTAPEVRTLDALYQGPVDSSGEPIFPGSAMGGERGWGQMTGPEPMSLARDVYRYMVFADESWEVETFDAGRDIGRGAAVIGPLMDAINPDLGPFVDNGGKLLLYHGWADPGITPYSTVEYYRSVVETMGARATGPAVRLFMVPGMGHCRGGEGPDTFDALEIIDGWVTGGEAPDRIVASRIRDGQVDRTRPLCPYPQVARYDGTGSTDRAENFSCVVP